MRIRTDGDFAHRRDLIERASEIWGCNKTQAVIRSCEFTDRMLWALDQARDHPDMTQDLAEVLSTRYVKVRYRIETEIEID